MLRTLTASYRNGPWVILPAMNPEEMLEDARTKYARHIIDCKSCSPEAASYYCAAGLNLRDKIDLAATYLAWRDLPGQ